MSLSLLETIIRDTSHTREEIVDSLSSRKYDDIMAYYLLLGIRTTEVRSFSFFCHRLFIFV